MEPMNGIVSWQRLSYILMTLVGIQCFFLYHSIGSSEPTHLPRPARLTEISAEASGYADLESTTQSNATNEYFFNEYVDSLTAEQCEIAFPDIYYEAERATRYWKKRNHIISGDDLHMPPDGHVRFLIHRNELRIINSSNAYSALGRGERALAVTNLLHRAVESAKAGGERLPTIEFTVSLLDITEPPTLHDTYTTWVWTRELADDTTERGKKQRRFWVMPNVEFYASMDRNLGAYHDARHRAAQHDSSLEDKIPEAAWRGTAWVNPELRGGLVNKTKGKPWASVHTIDANDPKHAHQLRMDEFCSYRFAIHTEGIAYSGRLQYLLNCDNLPIIHKLAWTTHWNHLLIPEGPQQNYIPVKRDWSDLESQVKFYTENPFNANMIVKNHLKTFRDRYLTRAATSCYIRRLMHEYASVSWRPEVDESVSRRNDTKTAASQVVRRRRGLSFEEVMLNPHDFRNASDFYGNWDYE